MNRRLQNCSKIFRETRGDASYSSSVFAYCFPIRDNRVLRNKIYPLLGISSSKLEISLLGRINQGGIFPCALKFEHAMLVVTCDIFLKHVRL